MCLQGTDVGNADNHLHIVTLALNIHRLTAMECQFINSTIKLCIEVNGIRTAVIPSSANGLTSCHSVMVHSIYFGLLELLCFSCFGYGVATKKVGKVKTESRSNAIRKGDTID